MQVSSNTDDNGFLPIEEEVSPPSKNTLVVSMLYVLQTSTKII
jgi:hypothetical protein